MSATVMMGDIRDLMNKRDLEYVRDHAEPLSPGTFVSVCDASNKFGGKEKTHFNGSVAIIGVLGIVFVGLVIYSLKRNRK
jgi:hypothetical protein